MTVKRKKCESERDRDCGEGEQGQKREFTLDRGSEVREGEEVVESAELRARLAWLLLRRRRLLILRTRRRRLTGACRARHQVQRPSNVRRRTLFIVHLGKNKIQTQKNN